MYGASDNPPLIPSKTNCSLIEVAPDSPFSAILTASLPFVFLNILSSFLVYAAEPSLLPKNNVLASKGLNIDINVDAKSSTAPISPSSYILFKSN